MLQETIAFTDYAYSHGGRHGGKMATHGSKIGMKTRRSRRSRFLCQKILRTNGQYKKMTTERGRRGAKTEENATQKMRRGTKIGKKSRHGEQKMVPRGSFTQTILLMKKALKIRQSFTTVGSTATKWRSSTKKQMMEMDGEPKANFKPILGPPNSDHICP